MDTPNSDQFIPGLTTTEYVNFLPSFRDRFKKAAEEGILLTVKYGLILVIFYLALQFGLNIVAGSQNGTASLNYLQQAINKGYLPKPGTDGQIPNKE